MDSEIFEIFLRPVEEVVDNFETRQSWMDLALSSDNLYAFYQSPIWWEYSTKVTLRDHILRLRYGSEPVIAHITVNDDKLIGLSGAFTTNYLLHFKLKNTVLASFNIPVVRLMGGQPLIVNDESVYVEFVKSLLKAFPGCAAIHIPWLPINSYSLKILNESKKLKRYSKIYVPDRDLNNHYYITLNQSFEEYLQKFNKKVRYNYKRDVKILNNHCNNQLNLVRIEQSKDAKMFLDEAALVSSKSWQHTLEQQMDNSPDEYKRYEDFAHQGILRCYLLKCGDTPCAFVRGFQFGDEFYYSRTGFDEKYKNLSPGRVLFYLMLEDLFAYNQPKRLNFQEGDYEYKRHFATDSQEKADILLISNEASIGNRIIIRMHSFFNSSIMRAKKIFAVKREFMKRINLVRNS